MLEAVVEKVPTEFNGIAEAVGTIATAQKTPALERSGKMGSGTNIVSLRKTNRPKVKGK